MSNNQGPIPKGAVFFADRIVEKLRLDRGATIGFIESVIQAAIREHEEVEHARELVGCHACGSLLSRYSCIQERFGTRCPHCGGPMAARDVLQMKRIAELEERLKLLEPRRDGQIST